MHPLAVFFTWLSVQLGRLAIALDGPRPARAISIDELREPLLWHAVEPNKSTLYVPAGWQVLIQSLDGSVAEIDQIGPSFSCLHRTWSRCAVVRCATPAAVVDDLDTDDSWVLDRLTELAK